MPVEQRRAVVGGEPRCAAAARRGTVITSYSIHYTKLYESVGAASYLGSNSAIIENITIGDRCLVGMGMVAGLPLDGHKPAVPAPTDSYNFV